MSDTATRTVTPFSVLPVLTDWHKPGVYVVRGLQKELLPDTLSETAYSARAAFVREHGLVWSQAIAKGFDIVELAPVAVMAAPERTGT